MGSGELGDLDCEVVETFQRHHQTMETGAHECAVASITAVCSECIEFANSLLLSVWTPLPHLPKFRPVANQTPELRSPSPSYTTRQPH